MARGKTTTPLAYCYSVGVGAVTLSHVQNAASERRDRVRISQRVQY